MSSPTFGERVQVIQFEVAKSLLTKWRCRHCGHRTPTITEFCDGCGIEDCAQGAGEESARDRKLRLAGKRGSTGIWTKRVVAGMVGGLTAGLPRR